MKIRRHVLYTCFYATSIALLLSSCKGIESKKVNTDTSENIANRATTTLVSSFASSPASAQTPQQSFITLKVEDGAKAETKIDELKNAIKFADDIDREVNQSLNTDILSKAYTGSELQKKEKFVSELKSHQTYIYSKLRKQVFHNFQISPDGLKAKVDLTETWSHKIFSQQSNELLAKSPAADVPQTNYLQKTEKGWLVYNTVFNGAPPTFRIIAKAQ